MKILFGVPNKTHRDLTELEIYGIEKFGHITDTIQYGPSSNSKKKVQKIKIAIVNAFAIAYQIKKNRYDVLFLNTAFDFSAVLRDVITLFIIGSSRVKIFLKFHGSDLNFLNELSYLQKKIVNYVFKNVAGVGVLSNEEKKEFVRLRYPSSKIFLVKNPINPTLYSKSEKFKDEIGISKETFLFLFCARFIKEKGLSDVLFALRDIVTKDKKIHLVAVGDGEEMEEAEFFVLNNHLSDYVTFTGFLPEKKILSYYSNSDALVFPTYHQEGFPMVVFQSLAAGLPIITTCIRACADYLKEPDNVIWVEAKNIQSIKEAMFKLLENKELVIKMSENNKKLSNNFTSEINAVEYIEIFNKIINNNK